MLVERGVDYIGFPLRLKELITVGNSNIVGHYINLENTDAAKFLEHVLDRQTISSR